MSNLVHLSDSGTLHYGMVKTKELTSKQLPSVDCPTCGASAKEARELYSGAPRTEPQRHLKLSAAEAVETKPGNR
jgi:hypothetical protein